MKINSYQNYILKVCLLFFLLTVLFSSIAEAQLVENSKIFLVFKDIDGEANVNGEDAKAMLKSYVVGKTNCLVVDSKDEANFIFQLSVIEKNMGNRSGRIDIIDLSSNNIIFDSEWRKGVSSAFYGYSGTRAVIGKIIKDHIIVKFPQIAK